MALKGMNELMRKIKELEKATAALDGELTSVSFDHNDPHTIELAIQKMETEIDQRVNNFHNNDMVQEIVIEIKERYRQAILDRAASARSEQESKQ